MSYQKHNWITREIIRRQLLQNIEDGIYNEQERAIAAEVELGAALSTETSRAVAKENQLNSSISSVNTALTSEVSRATTKENALQTSISNETTRATGVEGQLSSNISNVSSSLSTEVSRAMAAETTLQGNIDAEEARATAAEATLSSNISAERTRAQNAESDLHDYVDQKVTGLYKPGGSVYFASLPALDASKIGYVYDIIDAFTTTSDFREGAGKSYGPGTNVVIIDIGSSTLKYDVLPGFVDTSSFYGTGDTTETTIADSDYFPFYDVSASAKRKTLFSNLRAKLNIPGIATLLKAGIVKPDGTTIIVDANGVISSTGSSVSPQGLGFGYGTCSTAAATTAKTATLTGYNLVPNGYVSIKFTNAVPASATLNINSKGAKPIYYHGSAITAGVIGAGDLATFVYDGTNYHLVGLDSNNRVLYYTGQACAATTGNFCTISNSLITENHVVTECVFSKPSTITTDVTWTTASGSLTLNGTCTDATCTATITLCKKDN